MVLSVGKVYNSQDVSSIGRIWGIRIIIRKKRQMKKFLTTLIMTCMVFVLAACESGPVGFWKIDKVTAGDVIMTQEDASSLGLSTVGSVKLQKSGACVVDFLGEELEGTWTQAEDGTITITYGTEGLILSGAIDEEGVMLLRDEQGSEYLLSK